MIRAVSRPLNTISYTIDALEAQFVKSLVLAGTCQRHYATASRARKTRDMKTLAEATEKQSEIEDSATSTLSDTERIHQQNIISSARQNARLQAPLSLAISIRNAELAWTAYDRIAMQGSVNSIPDRDLLKVVQLIISSRAPKPTNYSRILKIISQLQKRGLEVPKWTLDGLTASLPNGLIEQSHIQMVMERIHQMELDNTVDVATYNASLALMDRANKPDLFDMVFRNMIRRQLTPDRSTYTILITHHRNTGDMESVSKWYDEAGKAGIIPDTTLLNTVISACVENDHMDKAHDLYNLMISSARMQRRKSEETTSDTGTIQEQLRPDVGTFDVLIRQARDVGDIEGAMKLLDDLREIYPPKHRRMSSLRRRFNATQKRQNRWSRPVIGVKTYHNPILEIHHVLFQAYTMHANSRRLDNDILERIYASFRQYNLTPLPDTVVVVAEAFEVAGISYDRLKALVQEVDARRTDAASDYWAEVYDQDDTDWNHFRFKIGKWDQRVLDALERVRVANPQQTQRARPTFSSDDHVTVEAFFDIVDQQDM